MMLIGSGLLSLAVLLGVAAGTTALIWKRTENYDCGKWIGAVLGFCMGCLVLSVIGTEPTPEDTLLTLMGRQLAHIPQVPVAVVGDLDSVFAENLHWESRLTELLGVMFALMLMILPTVLMWKADGMCDPIMMLVYALYSLGSMVTGALAVLLLSGIIWLLCVLGFPFLLMSIIGIIASIFCSGAGAVIIVATINK